MADTANAMRFYLIRSLGRRHLLLDHRQIRRIRRNAHESGFRYRNLKLEIFDMVIIILLDLSHGHRRVQSLIYEFLLISVFQKRPSVILQFLLHILFVLGQFFLCDIYAPNLMILFESSSGYFVLSFLIGTLEVYDNSSQLLLKEQ